MFSILLPLLLNQDPISNSREAPTPETTQRRIVELSEGMKNAQKLSSFLKTIGDIGKKQPGETELQFLKRVENGTKAQALLLIDLRNEYEKLLQSRYELEQLTKDYKAWLATRETDRLKALQLDKNSLKTFEDEVKVESAGLILIGKRLEEYLSSLAQTEKKKIDDFEDNLSKFKGHQKIDDSKIKEWVELANQQYVNQILKNSGLTPSKANEIIKFYKDLEDIRNEKVREIGFLRNKIQGQESINSMEDTDTSRVKVISEGKKILEETKKIETQAHSVALLSKYVRLNLISLNSPGRNAAVRIAELEARLTNDASQLDQYLKVLTNPDSTQGQNDKKTPDNLLDVFK